MNIEFLYTFEVLGTVSFATNKGLIPLAVNERTWRHQHLSWFVNDMLHAERYGRMVALRLTKVKREELAASCKGWRRNFDTLGNRARRHALV